MERKWRGKEGQEAPQHQLGQLDRVEKGCRMVWGVSHTPTKVSHFPSQNSQKDAMIPNKETVVETDVGQYI